MLAYRWKQIEDLEDWRKYIRPELSSLAAIWGEQKSTLARTDAFIDFNQRLCREWAIETGIIENLYTLDRGITVLLIEKGIEASLIPHGSSDKPSEELVGILEDHREALEGLFEFASKRRNLSTSYIKQVHAELTRHQETTTAIDSDGNLFEVVLQRGEWKKLPNNPKKNGEIHEYCPPEHVASEMDNLIAWHLEHQKMDVAPEVEAAWLHHRFTQIHPFQDGNGRVARLLASLVFIRAGLFPLVIHRDVRGDYLDSLESADNGDLLPLVTLFEKRQKNALRKALSVSDSFVRQAKSRKSMLEAVSHALRVRRENKIKEQNLVFGFADSIQARCMDALRTSADELRPVLQGYNSNYNCIAEDSHESNAHWFRKQIIDCANEHDYYADLRTYSAWARLRIFEEREAGIIFSFHSFGLNFVGIAVVSAFLEYRDRHEEGGPSDIDGPYVVCDEVFQFSYKEDLHSIEIRFDKWVSEAILVAMDQWRRQL
jgi:Fic family protein